ncbi:hypothetical protein SJAG_00843 [Schizosaccharomyces japonicus yFS275]|uniref:Uncharacterized protein n=1 Tax=Schizosaccharomyces japonicus (strain yFS275 / FY16936) TaxID=402676 RepID=B6JWR6_SCHJY|nr:hypothetical protein SJAG_00843 [Schizosaccharomyces japonicus yFS275]EEB05817.1 hypothetical protein SJAG_00843 [Schizosaccharomyces japonicus yFS275]
MESSSKHVQADATVQPAGESNQADPLKFIFRKPKIKPSSINKTYLSKAQGTQPAKLSSTKVNGGTASVAKTEPSSATTTITTGNSKVRLSIKLSSSASSAASNASSRSNGTQTAWTHRVDSSTSLQSGHSGSAAAEKPKNASEPLAAADENASTPLFAAAAASSVSHRNSVSTPATTLSSTNSVQSMDSESAVRVLRNTLPPKPIDVAAASAVSSRAQSPHSANFREVSPSRLPSPTKSRRTSHVSEGKWDEIDDDDDDDWGSTIEFEDGTTVVIDAKTHKYQPVHIPPNLVSVAAQTETAVAAAAAAAAAAAETSPAARAVEAKATLFEASRTSSNSSLATEAAKTDSTTTSHSTILRLNSGAPPAPVDASTSEQPRPAAWSRPAWRRDSLNEHQQQMYHQQRPPTNQQYPPSQHSQHATHKNAPRAQEPMDKSNAAFPPSTHNEPVSRASRRSSVSTTVSQRSARSVSRNRPPAPTEQEPAIEELLEEQHKIMEEARQKAIERRKREEEELRKSRERALRKAEELSKSLAAKSSASKPAAAAPVTTQTAANDYTPASPEREDIKPPAADETQTQIATGDDASPRSAEPVPASNVPAPATPVTGDLSWRATCRPVKAKKSVPIHNTHTVEEPEQAVPNVSTTREMPANPPTSRHTKSRSIDEVILSIKDVILDNNAYKQRSTPMVPPPINTAPSISNGNVFESPGVMASTPTSRARVASTTPTVSFPILPHAPAVPTISTSVPATATSSAAMPLTSPSTTNYSRKAWLQRHRQEGNIRVFLPKVPPFHAVVDYNKNGTAIEGEILRIDEAKYSSKQQRSRPASITVSLPGTKMYHVVKCFATSTCNGVQTVREDHVRRERMNAESWRS